MMEYKDNDFGNLIKSIRDKNKINAETLVRGICSLKVLNNIESGKTFPGYLLRNFLIDRLGLAREWFENMLTVGEYEEWQCRRRIISQLRKKEYMSADALVEEYRKKYIAGDIAAIDGIYAQKLDENEADEKLRLQFYYTVKGMCGKDGEEPYYELAAALTSKAYHGGIIDESILSRYKLSIGELNLYLEAVWHSKAAGNKEKVINALIACLDTHYYDIKTKVKIFPKLAVYYCRLNENTTDLNVLRRMQKICDEAISLLRAQKRAYYIVELFNIYLCIADKLCETLKDDGHVGFQKQVKFDKRRIRQWLDAILNEYRIREVPLTMPNDFYIYQEGTAYCINDVIRARRELLRFNRKYLCDGICAEKTIEKTEQHKSNLQYANMKLIYNRLNLPCTYQYASLIVPDIITLEREEEINQLAGRNELSDALAAMEELKKDVPGYSYNMQELGWIEQIILNNRWKLTPQDAADRVKTLIELTVPLKYIDNFINNRNHGLRKNEQVSKRIYFTRTELACIVSLAGYYGKSGLMEKAMDYMGLLYEYLTNNGESDDVYCMESVFTRFMTHYTSMLGDIGNFEVSDRLADEAAKRMLELYRPEKIWWHKYNNLWNDETKEKDKEKYNSVLRECAALCEIYDGESVAKIFTNKIVSSC